MKRYVADTHSILWHWAKSRRLSRRVRRIFDAAKDGRAQILIPSIVLVEAIFLMQRRRVTKREISQLFMLSEKPDANFYIVPLDLAVAETVGDFGPAAIPDMPDRIIAATARTWNLPLITADSIITQSGLVEVVW